MAKYKCKVCGYVHEGNKAPDTCPVCSAPASEFEEIKEEGAAKKGINRDSNVYTVVYAAVMVVLVAVVLAFTSQSLRSFQKQNEDNDKRQQILRSINVNVSSSEAETKYNELIKEANFLNEKGEKVGVRYGVISLSIGIRILFMVLTSATKVKLRVWELRSLNRRSAMSSKVRRSS